MWSLCSITFDRPSCLRSSRVFHLWLQQPTSASIHSFTIIHLYLCYDFDCHLVPYSHGATLKVARPLCRSHNTASCHPRQDFWPQDGLASKPHFVTIHTLEVRQEIPHMTQEPKMPASHKLFCVRDRCLPLKLLVSCFPAIWRAHIHLHTYSSISYTFECSNVRIFSFLIILMEWQVFIYRKLCRTNRCPTRSGSQSCCRWLLRSLISYSPHCVSCTLTGCCSSQEFADSFQIFSALDIWVASRTHQRASCLTSLNGSHVPFQRRATADWPGSSLSLLGVWKSELNHAGMLGVWPTGFTIAWPRHILWVKCPEFTLIWCVSNKVGFFYVLGRLYKALCNFGSESAIRTKSNTCI